MDPKGKQHPPLTPPSGENWFLYFKQIWNYCRLGSFFTDGWGSLTSINEWMYDRMNLTLSFPGGGHSAAQWFLGGQKSKNVLKLCN